VASAAFIAAPWIGLKLYSPDDSALLWTLTAATVGLVALLAVGPMARLMPSSPKETDNIL
ncbi:MAG: hypothetical protein AAF449_24045, partial [Myxococcota bacterium]